MEDDAVQNKVFFLAILLFFSLHLSLSVAPGETAESGRSFVEAVEGNDVEAVRSLLASGFALNGIVAEETTGAYYTPLAFAVLRCRPEMAAILLGAGADPDGKSSSGIGALHIAVGLSDAPEESLREGGLQILDLLLKHGANPDLPDGRDATPLALAVQSGDPAVALLLAQRLLTAGADTARHAFDGGVTPLLAAVGAGAAQDPANPERAIERQHGFETRIEVVSLLLAAGANPSAAVADGTTPLHAAATYSPAMVRTLLAAKANPRLKDAKGQTPLDWAKEYGNEEVIEILTEAVKNKKNKKK